MEESIQNISYKKLLHEARTEQIIFHPLFQRWSNLFIALLQIMQ